MKYEFFGSLIWKKIFFEILYYSKNWVLNVFYIVFLNWKKLLFYDVIILYNLVL